MANRLYNKQVTPKGYQKGGSVKQSPMGSSSTKGNILRGKLKSQKELKKITDSKKYKDASYGEKTKMLNVATMKKGGRIRKMGGGTLKPVNPKTQKGLSKLPTEVRNKMGYMQDGGKVKDKPGKNVVLGKTFHPITENAMVNNIVKRFNSRDKKFASVNDLQDRHKEIKEKYFDKGVKPSEIQKLDKEFKSRLVKAKSRANKMIANRPGMKEYRNKQQKAKAIDTGSEN